MIGYSTDTDGLTAEDLEPFFDGWRARPEPARRLAAVRGATLAVLARDDDRLVGFITAVTDGALFAFVPLLEVLGSHRGRGIGTELVRRAMDELRHHYALDLVCDEDLVPFYERFGMVRSTAMSLRRYEG